MKKLFVSCSCFLVTALLSVQADNKMDKQTDVVVFVKALHSRRLE